jgi:hypothetical protein
MDDRETRADVDISRKGDGSRAVGGASTVHVLGVPARRFALARSASFRAACIS